MAKKVKRREWSRPITLRRSQISHNEHFALRALAKAGIVAE
jgi:hypothetical protein